MSTSFKPPVLISRYMLDQGKDFLSLVLQRRKEYELLIDSGAFTAFQKNFSYTVQDYISWISKTKLAPDKYIQLDVIGDEQATVKNLDITLQAGQNPIPVFTRGSKLSTLEYMYKQAPMVAVGGLVGSRNRNGYVKWVMNHIKSRPVHLLGFAPLPFLARYKPTSCDTSGWGQTHRYGQMRLYSGGGKWSVLSKQDFLAKPSKKVQNQIALYGGDIYQLSKMDGWRFKNRVPSTSTVIAARGWARYVTDLKSRYGVTLYSVAGVPHDLEILLDAFKWNEEQTW